MVYKIKIYFWSKEGTLDEHLALRKMNDQYPDAKIVKKWCKNILNGLNYLHQFGK